MVAMMSPRPPRRSMAWIAALAACVALSACQDMRKGPYGEIFEWGDEPGWTEYTIMKHGWARHYPKPAPMIYCYSSLAAPECYDTPQPQLQSRLIGSFDGGIPR